MITLETLPGDAGSVQNRRRIGRGHGSGWGKTSGRGHKGAAARSGFKRRPGFEGGQMPIYRRLPKRGFKNPFRVPTEIVNISSLNHCFEDGAVVDAQALAAARLIERVDGRIKILAEGELKKKLTVKASAFSAKAKEAIESCGGACEVI